MLCIKAWQTELYFASLSCSKLCMWLTSPKTHSAVWHLDYSWLSKKMPRAWHGNSLGVGGSSNSIPGVLCSLPYIAAELWIKNPLSSYFHPIQLFLHEKGSSCKKMRIKSCFQSGVSLCSQQHHSLVCFSILFQESMIHRVFCLQQVHANVG